MRRRLARWGKRLALAFLALIAAITVAAAIYDGVTSGGESAHALYSGPYVRVDGRELAYRRWGTHGSPIVLIGGFIEASDVWRRTAPMNDVRDALMNWRKPALVVWGSEDTVLLPRIAEHFVELIPGAHSPATLIDGASHFLQEDRPDEVTAAILGFAG